MGRTVIISHCSKNAPFWNMRKTPRLPLHKPRSKPSQMMKDYVKPVMKPAAMTPDFANQGRR
jgi:hypothetical protein